MPVYVDNARIPFGRMIMCHMMADSTQELKEMARRLEIPTYYVQCAGTEREHFDVCLAKRDRALELGAMEVTTRQLIAAVRRKRYGLQDGKGPLQERPLEIVTL